MWTHLHNEDFDRLVAGEAEPSQVAHVRDCEDCRERLAEQIAAERALFSRLYRVACPPPLTLLEQAAGLRNDPAIARHLAAEGAGCPHCQEEVATLATWQAMPLAAQPPRTGLGERLRTIFARLHAPPAAAPALRGEPSKQVVYEAGELIVTLDRLPSTSRAGRTSLLGSVLAQDGDFSRLEGAVARLSKQGDLVDEKKVSEFGNFVFEGLTAGTYRLSLTLPDLYVVIDQLAID